QYWSSDVCASDLKTGTPAIPTSVYVIILILPSFLPSIKPANMAKNVCKDKGTLAPPIGTASIGNQTAIFAPIAIKHTNIAPNVRSMGLNFKLFTSQFK